MVVGGSVGLFFLLAALVLTPGIIGGFVYAIRFIKAQKQSSPPSPVHSDETGPSSPPSSVVTELNAPLLRE